MLNAGSSYLCVQYAIGQAGRYGLFPPFTVAYSCQFSSVKDFGIAMSAFGYSSPFSAQGDHDP